MIQIYRLSTLPVFYAVYVHYTKKSSKILLVYDHYLLITTHLMLFTVMVGQWFMHVNYIVLFGLQIYLSWIMCSLDHKGNRILPSLKTYLVATCYIIIWFIIRIHCMKNYEYGINTYIGPIKFEGIAKTLQGWNCNEFQFWLLPLFWLILEKKAYDTAQQIILEESDKDHEWKRIFINKKIMPDFLYLSIWIIYTFVAYLDAKNPVECSKYWVGLSTTHQIAIDIIKLCIYSLPCLNNYYFYDGLLKLYDKNNSGIVVQQNNERLLE